VDRLMKQITNFMSDIADEFKIVVVEAIRSLCLKYPRSTAFCKCPWPPTLTVVSRYWLPLPEASPEVPRPARLLRPPPHCSVGAIRSLCLKYSQKYSRPVSARVPAFIYLSDAVRSLCLKYPEILHPGSLK